jgi:hypothetical protein
MCRSGGAVDITSWFADKPGVGRFWSTPVFLPFVDLTSGSSTFSRGAERKIASEMALGSSADAEVLASRFRQLGRLMAMGESNHRRSAGWRILPQLSKW